MVSRVAKRTLATLRDIYTARYFHDPRRGPRYRGVYPTYEAAVSALPKNVLHGFDDESVPEYFEKHLLAFNPGDYPVLFWLQRMLLPNSTIFDFGGGLGQCFYAYQEMLQFPPEVQWTVCDVEAMVKRGGEFAQKRGARNLHFTTDRQAASGVTFFLTNGTLQYVPEDLPQLLSGLTALPQYLLINRVPMYEGKSYYTIQSSAHSYSPYRIFNTREFITQLRSIGYELGGEWKLPRGLHVQFHAEISVESYKGLYFYRKGDH